VLRYTPSTPTGRTAGLQLDVAYWPILLKKSFLAKKPIFAEALVRSLKIYVRAHMSTLTSNRRAL
jgi:hypothetical protein